MTGIPIGKVVKNREEWEQNSVWMEISSEKRFSTRPGQKSTFGGWFSQLI
jgi:hypothetical protein